MIIRNKKTGIEREISIEQWEQIKSVEDLSNRFVIVGDSIKKEISKKENIKITTAEVVDFMEKKSKKNKNK